ncbi:MAG: glycosyltransferase family 39 protein, partial [Acidobacteriota bacterium]
MEDETLPTAATPRRRRRERLALGALLFFFAAITAFFANFHPSHGRFYDERFALQNVHSVLQRQAFEPANGYYPTLSYMPQTLALGFLEAYGQRSEGRSWIYRETPPPSADVLPPAAGRAFTPLAYRVSRGVQILWGLLTLVALFALGRRAFGAAAAGVGVTLLALTPWFMLSAAKFKPDAALLATSVLALWLSARASERPFSWRGYAAAGAAIAAAMSCKLTGGLTALPLTAVAIAQALRERRRLAGLATAGATSLALFLIANPHLLFYLHFMQRLSSEYEDKAKAYGGTHLGVAGSSLELVVSREGFGPIFGALALVGFVILGLRGWRRGGALRRPSAAILWLFAPIYLAAFAASTPHFKPNNVLSTLPPLALIAGWLTVDLGRRMAFAARERGPQTRLARAALGLAVAA